MRAALIFPLLLAACAAAPRAPSGFDGQVTGGLGANLTIHDVRLRPVEIVEDSRCPVDVDCVWAGRLRARVEIEGRGWSRVEVMELGHGIALEDARRLALTEASPAPRQGERPSPGAYRLTFTLGPGD